MWGAVGPNKTAGMFSPYEVNSGFVLFQVEIIFTARKRSLEQGNIFIGVCQEFCSQGGGLLRGEGVSTPGGVSSGGGRVQGCLLRGCPVQGGYLVEIPPTNTPAGGTHPTGMHSCVINLIIHSTHSPASGCSTVASGVQGPAFT